MVALEGKDELLCVIDTESNFGLDLDKKSSLR